MNATAAMLENVPNSDGVKRYAMTGEPATTMRFAAPVPAAMERTARRGLLEAAPTTAVSAYPRPGISAASQRRESGATSYAPELIIPAPTVMPVASSMRMNEPVVRFFE